MHIYHNHINIRYQEGGCTEWDEYFNKKMRKLSLNHTITIHKWLELKVI